MTCRRPPLLRALLGLLMLATLPHVSWARPQEEPSAQQTPPTDAEANPKKKRSRKARVAALPPKYQMWLESVDFIISKEEREIFLDLQKDYQRDAFIERFWKARDPYPSTLTNELRERYEAAVEYAREHFGSLSEDRSRIYLLNEPPDLMMSLDCVEMWPAEIWYWQRNPKIGSPMGILFFQIGGGGPYRIWYPDDGIRALAKFTGDANSVIESCNMQEQEALGFIINLIRTAGSMGFSSLLAELQIIPEIPRGEWVETFHAYSTDLEEGAAELPAWLAIEYPGRHQSRTVMQGIIKVPADKVAISNLADYGQTYNIMLTGEIIREDSLFDSFRYQYNFPVEQIQGENIPLVFDRYLRPGEYNLVLRLEDLNSTAEHRQEVTLSVPEVDNNAPVTPSDPETARILAEANAAISRGDSTIKIVPLRGQYSTGLMRIDTLTTGREISSVVFDLDDGQQYLVKNSPPWSVELDLGSLPRMRTLTVIGLDSSGQEVARDVAQLNSGSHRFDVRIIEPRRKQKYLRSLRAEAQLDIPEGGSVDKVEFYLNEDLVATLFQPPWTHPILLNSDNELAYVRVVAYQPDGNFIEDTVWVNAPDYMENLDIQFVELYITVLDKSKHPVLNLGEDQFRVFEDGQPQEVRRFEKVTNLPIHAGILLDVSASMEKNLETALKAALKFLEEGITPRDRASIVTFNDHPNLAVKFTNDMPVLASGLAGLRAERGTALYDSVIFSLYYFNGIKGQRALILLSDGKDEHSRFEWEDTLEYARRAGVAIYSIGLTLGKKSGDAKKKLVKLAEETGGRSFFIDEVGDLAGVYEVILEELRSRYFLAYQSTNTAEDTAFRTVNVEVDGSGLEAKTLRGYYP